jgi:hypothetical protein
LKFAIFFLVKLTSLHVTSSTNEFAYALDGVNFGSSLKCLRILAEIDSNASFARLSLASIGGQLKLEYARANELDRADSFFTVLTTSFGTIRSARDAISSMREAYERMRETSPWMN